MAKKAKRTGERTDWIHLVVTVSPDKNTFKLRKFPPELEANQFCYAFRVTIKEEDWLDRIKEVTLPTVTAPNTPALMGTNHDSEHFHIFQGITEQIPRSIGEQMIDRLDGRGPGKFMVDPSISEKRIEIE